MKGCAEWLSFEATAEEHPLPGGLGNQETFRSGFWPGFVGLATRVYHPATKQWSISWVDNRNHTIDPPVLGGELLRQPGVATPAADTPFLEQQLPGGM